MGTQTPAHTGRESRNGLEDDENKIVDNHSQQLTKDLLFALQKQMCRVTTDIRMGGNSVYCRSKEQPKRRHEESKQQREIVAKRTPLPQPIRSRENIWSLQH